jgi:hypothetical protein
MTSIIAFPQERVGDRSGDDADAFKIGAELKAKLESEEDRNRGRINLFAALAVIVLIIGGWFLVNSFIKMQKAQGCYASGARYCSLL